MVTRFRRDKTVELKLQRMDIELIQLISSNIERNGPVEYHYWYHTVHPISRHSKAVRCAWRVQLGIGDAVCVTFFLAKSKLLNKLQVIGEFLAAGVTCFCPALPTTPFPVQSLDLRCAVGVCSTSNEKSDGSQVWDLETLGCDALISCDFLSTLYDLYDLLYILLIYYSCFLELVEFGKAVQE